MKEQIYIYKLTQRLWLLVPQSKEVGADDVLDLSACEVSEVSVCVCVCECVIVCVCVCATHHCL